MRHTQIVSATLLLTAGMLSFGAPLRGGDRTLHTFKTQQLTDVYYSEGAGAGDIDGDGNSDVVCGPYWFAGPQFQQKHEIFKPVPQNREKYANNFFSWVHDFNSDGWNDVFVVGFPGTPAYVYENPKQGNFGQHWRKHQVFDWVSNESPFFGNIVGDEKPELVCTRDGFFGYATIDWKRPFEAWTFHPISAQIASKRFGHGLGVGDINGDGRLDVIHSKGWFQQPAKDADKSRWMPHDVSFSNSYGGAEMYAYDVDGDGDNDVITSHAAHDFGLAWYEQTRDGDAISFKHHLIMGDRPQQSRYGVVFSEPHSVSLADIDGDGLNDIVTGKTYWSHHRKSPMWDAGAVVYWFRLVRNNQGVDWVPYRAGEESGIGRQLGVHDVNGDGLLDFVVGGMQGAHVLIHQSRPVDEATWKAAQPKRFVSSNKRSDRGKPSEIDATTGRVAGAIEGESMKVVSLDKGKTRTQDMTAFTKDRWSGGKQLFWTGATPRAPLKLQFEVAQSGEFDVAIALTTARDYGIVNLLLDNVALGTPVDSYDYPDVRTTGLLELGTRKLAAGKHELMLELIGANDSAKKAYMVGLDYLLLTEKP